MTKPMRLLAAAVVWAVFSSHIVPVTHAQGIDVMIPGGTGQTIPVAVVPFGWGGSGELPQDVAQLIENDLERSLYFSGIERTSMVARPTNQLEVVFADWRGVAAYLVVGRITPATANNVQIQFQVFDVLLGQMTVNQQIPTPVGELQRSAHRISDAILQALLGVSGAFDTRIVYVSAEGNTPASKRYSLWIADSDLQNPRRLFGPVAQPILSPVLSPDGRTVAFGVWEEQGRDDPTLRKVYLQTISTVARQEIAPPPGLARGAGVSAPAFSADGRYLAVSVAEVSPSTGVSTSSIYVREIATGVYTRLTTHASVNTEPTWSPDSLWVYFMSDRAGSPRIYRVRTDGSAVTEPVTPPGVRAAEPRISPDGRHLAVVLSDAQGDRIALFNLQNMTGNAQPSFLSDGPFDESPSFAPNGTVLVYATQQGGTKALATVSTLDRRFFQQRFTTVQGDIQEPFWGSFPAQ